MNDYKKILSEGLIHLCDKNDPDLIDMLLDFMELTLETNKYMNLTAITDCNEFIVKHYLDSLSICKSEAFIKAKTVIDVGTGGGFPGMPLAIVYPDKQFVLMDSLNKRINFLLNAVDELKLDNVECIHSRAEDLGRKPEYREKFDLCVSRAVSRLAILSEYCLPFVNVGGYFVPYKTVSEDLNLGNNAVKILGGVIESVVEFSDISNMDITKDLEHRLVFIKKQKNTGKNYPRKSGMPSKNPL